MIPPISDDEVVASDVPPRYLFSFPLSSIPTMPKPHITFYSLFFLFSFCLLVRSFQLDRRYLSSFIARFLLIFTCVLYKTVCPPVGPSRCPSVGPSVHHTRVDLLKNTIFKRNDITKEHQKQKSVSHSEKSRRADASFTIALSVPRLSLRM